jgi:hypothetical protein
LSLLTNIGLKSVLSAMSITTPAYFQGPFVWKIFFHSFTLSLCLSLPGRCIFYRQKNGLFLFFNTICLLVWRIKTITIQKYYWNIYSNSCHFIGFVMLDSSLFLIHLCFHLFILSHICMIVFIFLFCVQDSFKNVLLHGLVIMNCFSFVMEGFYFYFSYER